ncbi:hypothetical protein WIW50_04570 [Flavobacteriaceae bacterium 3-367]|uniref:hypothetical protein n=1 Tax=Eudoraea algarum TaxID=3417568 RepID=UPI00327F5CA6
MKKIVFVLALLIGLASYSQNGNDVSVERVIKTFYDGFNERDSVKIKLALHRNVKYQKLEDVFWIKAVKENDISEVIKSIMAIPKTTKFKLEASDVSIHADEYIANAWVKTKFYLYDSYYQCGSTSFQLVKEDDDWKIFSILDHYSKENCKEQ